MNNMKECKKCYNESAVILYGENGLTQADLDRWWIDNEEENINSPQSVARRFWDWIKRTFG